MGSEAEKPTETVQSNNQQFHRDKVSPENRANGYEDVTNSRISYDDGGGGDSEEGDGKVGFIHPHSLLPKPVPPEILKANKNGDASVAGGMPSIGSFIRQQSNDLSAAIAKRVSSFRQTTEENEEKKDEEVTEFNLSGVKVVVELKPEEEPAMKGRISFFSRSGCRDCTAVRRFFREKGLKFVEVNVDVFRERERELRERTGSTSVPQIFFNERLVGGLVALNSLRNSGEFERRVAELLGEKLPGGDAPPPPVYGIDYLEEDRTDEMVGVISVLRQRLPIQDRFRKMKIVKNCFDGNGLVEVLVHYLNCARNEVRFTYRMSTYFLFFIFVYC